MDNRQRTHLSKFLSRHLRHAPGDIGLTLEPGGWVPVQKLLEQCKQAGKTMTRADLEEIVTSNDKQRFAFDATGDKIRANQGHSVDVDLELEPAVPPEVLYHGTAVSNLDSILKTGLSRRNRHHVHLSSTTTTATAVGARHGRPLVFVVDAQAMHTDGHSFFCSANGVWLVESVPPQYLRVL